MPISMTRDGARYYLIHDQVGTLRAVMDQGGSPVKLLEYDSFGNVISDSAPEFAAPFGFAGGFADKDTGLVRFGHRDYDPDTGRWTAKDPIGFEGGDTDLYGYVLGDPVNFIDPEGANPLLIVPVVWGVIEVGLSLYDAYDAGKTLFDPCASNTEKALAVGGFAMGLGLPGGGYGRGFRFTREMLSNAKVIAKGKDIDKVETLVKKFGGKVNDWKKKKSWDEFGNEWHWYENNGQKFGVKQAGEPDPF